MRIDALTTCTGEQYAKYLSKSLPIWADTCDAVWIATDERTAPEIQVNNGAALSSLFGLANPDNWVLNFDSDILPPKNWRRLVEQKLPVGKLLGCSHRYREDGSQIADANYPNIWGFFHLWHVNDHHSWRRPVYTVDCGHAGNYDHTFMMQWPNKDRVDLWPGIKLVHQGEPRQSWFGSDPKNERKMINLFTLGLYEAWITKAGHVKVPPFESEIVIDHQTIDATRQLLRQFTDPDPFKYKVEVKGAA